jgi:hypothetical protein
MNLFEQQLSTSSSLPVGKVNLGQQSHQRRHSGIKSYKMYSPRSSRAAKPYRHGVNILARADAIAARRRMVLDLDKVWPNGEICGPA